LGVAVVAFLGGQATAHFTSGWVSPVVRGVLAIGGLLGITWLVRIKLNKKPWSGMALPRPQMARLLLGGFCGACVIWAVFGIEYLAGWLHLSRISTQAHGGVPKLALILIQLIPSLGVGFSEELAFRGYVFQTLGERSPVWVATIITGVLFVFVHFSVPGFGINFVLSAILVSAMFVVMRLVTGSLWFPIGFHAMYDWAQTYPLGVSAPGQYNPALIQLSESGPEFWVGGAQAESGLLDVLAVIVTVTLVLAYGRYIGRNPRWTHRLWADEQARP
jgi:membrane protease YdiL (CAAX protease family)